MVQPFYYLQYVELSQVRQSKIIQVGMCTVIEAACRFEHTILRTGDNRRIVISFYATVHFLIIDLKNVGVWV